MSPDELPESVRLEVKTSRRERFVLGERDLQGVRPDGHVAALLAERRAGGPRWVLVPVARLSAGSASVEDLAAKAEPSALASALQEHWSDWLLDDDARRRLAASPETGVRERVAWCRAEHPPRQNKGRGALRSVRLAGALAALQRELDGALPGAGAQLEGQLHQALLEDALEALGYEILPNPVGVPDVTARRARGPRGAAERARERLLAWRPAGERAERLRALALALEPGEWAAFCAALGIPPAAPGAEASGPS